MSSILSTLQIALAAVFLTAAAGKLLRSDAFVAALRASDLPPVAAVPIAAAVGSLELALALALPLTPSPLLPPVFGAAAALLAIFTAWMAWVRGRRLRIRCGCFGVAGGEVGVRTIGRNVLLLALALAGLALSGWTASALPGPSLPMAAIVTSLATILLLLLALHGARPHLIVTLDELRRRWATAE